MGSDEFLLKHTRSFTPGSLEKIISRTLGFPYYQRRGYVVAYGIGGTHVVVSDTPEFVFSWRVLDNVGKVYVPAGLDCEFVVPVGTPTRVLKRNSVEKHPIVFLNGEGVLSDRNSEGYVPPRVSEVYYDLVALRNNRFPYVRLSGKHSMMVPENPTREAVLRGRLQQMFGEETH